MLRRKGWGARHTARPRSRKKPGKRLDRKLLWGARLLLALVVLNYLLAWLDWNVRPVMLANARYECERYANEVLQTALLQRQGIDPALYEGLYELNRDENGNIDAVILNSGRINQLEAALTGQLQAGLASVAAERTLPIPLGILLGSQMWVGPRLKIRLFPDGFAVVRIYDSLEAAGLNQTKLCLKARFTVRMCATLAGYGSSIDVEQEILLTEILLTGEVPQGYWSSGT